MNHAPARSEVVRMLGMDDLQLVIARQVGPAQPPQTFKGGRDVFQVQPQAIGVVGAMHRDRRIRYDFSEVRPNTLRHVDCALQVAVLASRIAHPFAAFGEIGVVSDAQELIALLPPLRSYSLETAEPL